MLSLICTPSCYMMFPQAGWFRTPFTGSMPGTLFPHLSCKKPTAEAENHAEGVGWVKHLPQNQRLYRAGGEREQPVLASLQARTPWFLRAREAGSGSVFSGVISWSDSKGCSGSGGRQVLLRTQSSRQECAAPAWPLPEGCPPH